MITRESHALLTLHWHYRNGFLPERGALLEQKAVFLDAMEFIDRAFRSIEAERIEEERQAAKRQLKTKTPIVR